MRELNWLVNTLNNSALRRASIGVAVLAFLFPAFVRAGDKLQYNRDVRPIFAESCFACHGPDSAARKASLRLDQRDEALKKVIVPGKPDESKLVERIYSEKDSKHMPPPKSGKKLTDAQRETLKRWIADGAEYQPLWSFIPPIRPAPPKVNDQRWVRNPIDAFILANLEKQSLTPAPEADRRTLARRLSLDLIGLPPKPEDVEAFVNDASTDAYEKYVDHLLESPHWGEHRGRYWLDAARYADTHGIHFDNYREIWAYRDWVINALNKNMPFDKFTIEQLAGDLLPNRTLDQQIATGFNRCNITTNEGGAINEEYLVLYTRDRTETTARVWLGLTANCAVCHDHKFDPISQKEFYEMSAFFNNTTQGAMDGNIKDTPPIIPVPMPQDRARWNTLGKELAEARKQADDRKQAARADFDKWLAAATRDTLVARIPNDGLTLHAPLDEGSGNDLYLAMDGKPVALTARTGFAWDAGHVAAKALKTRPGGTVAFPTAGDFEKDKGFSFGAWVKLPRNGLTGALFARMDDQHDFRGWDLWIQNERVGTHIVSKWQDDALKVVSKNPVKAGQWNHVFVTYDGKAKAAGTKVYINGVAQETNVEADALKSSIKTAVPLKLAQRNTTSRLDDVSIQDMRLYDRTLSPEEVARLAGGTRAAWLLAKPADQRTDAEKNELFDGWLKTDDSVYLGLARKVADLQGEEAAIKARGTVAHVMQERPQEPEAFVLFRGDYDKRRDKVKPGTPTFLPAMPDDLPKNRLGYAEWLLRPENPLTARVTVNRFWQEIFGNGIVRTSGDFGVSGEAPSNQELLDWMAVEFRESGWDVKKFFKLIVTSSTYRQSAAVTKDKLEKDPQNRLLSRGARFRMDAEMIRDYALASSGLLVEKVGGPSVRPYQPIGVWEAVAMIGSDTRDYRSDAGDKLYRRSLYTFWKRAAPPASMEILNAPSRELCTVRRERTDTPLQALVTLNDPQFVEAARFLAEKTLNEAGDKPEDRINFMSKRLLARPMRPEELKVVQTVLDDLLAHYKDHADEAKKLIAVGESKADPKLDPGALAAWTMIANQLLNLDEVLNK
jgi:mono/diheme cytochrome c family protein